MGKNDHHYIPVTLQRQFAEKGQKGLYYYDKAKPEKGVEWRTFERIFYKPHLNTFHHPDGTKDKSLEVFFDRNFENFLPNIIRKLKTRFTNTPEKLSHDEETTLIQFCVNHMLRSPDFHGPMLERHAPSKVFSQQEIDNIRVGALRHQPTKFMDWLAVTPMVLAKPSNPSSNFIVGSKPVMYLQKKGARNGTFASGDLEIWAPFGSRLAVGFVPGWQGEDTHLLNSQKVEHWNATLAAQSSSFASRNKHQIMQLAKRFPH